LSGSDSNPLVVFVMWHSTGHLNASFGVAKRLRALGYIVLYIGPSDIQSRVERENFQFAETTLFQYFRVPIGIGRRISDLLLRLRKPGNILEAVREGRTEYGRIRSSAPAIVAEMRSLVARLKPRFLVFDPFLLFFYIPIHSLGIPSVALSTKSLASKGQNVPPYTNMTIPRLTGISRLAISFGWALQTLRYSCWTAYERCLFGGSPYCVARWLSQVAQFPLAEEWTSRSIITDLRFRSVKEWVLHAPEFDFPRTNAERAGAVYMGPCVDLNREEAEFDWKLLPRGRLLCCLLTSVFHPGSAAAKRRVRFIHELAQAMRGLPDCAIVVAIGKGIDIPRTQIPANVLLVDNIPALAVIKRAELVITQAGGNSAKESIMLGTPLLVFPDAADQPGFSARLAFHGLALRYPLRNARARQICRLIARSLRDHDMHGRVVRMGTIFNKYDADAVRFASLVKLIDPCLQYPKPC
jgi:zeaxanthin glucosyltransferase